MKRLILLTAALLIFGSAGSTFAQETSGSIRGRVVDVQGLGVPGVTVTAAGPQGTKTTTSDGEGRFSLPFMTPGVYAVRAELAGFKAVAQNEVAVRLGQATDLPLRMEVGGVAETVNVTGTTPLLDVASTTIGSVLSTDSLATLPVGRRVSDALYLAPGVSSSGTLGRSNPSVSGGTGLENQYVVDGANVTNTGYGGLGSYSIIFGSLGNATPYNFVEEIQIKTGGYEAEFGQATGGVVNVVTKSGSNIFRGSFFGSSQPNALEAEWMQFQAANGSVNTIATEANDFGAGVGGPIVRDRLFFFGSISPAWQSRTLTAPPNFPLASLGEVERKRRTVSYAAKGTFQFGNGQRIDTSFFGDPSHGDTGPQRTSSLLVNNTASFSTIDYGGHQQTVRYDGVVNSRWLMESAFARSLNTISELPTVNEWRITDTTVTPNIITGGIAAYEKGNRSLSRQYTVKSTHIFGGHQLKYGLQYDDVVYAQENQRTGPTFLAPDGRQTATGASISILPDPVYGKIYRVTRANFNSERTTLQDYYNFFVQDTWTVGDRLTLNPGLRYEQEKLVGTIITDFTLKNNWAPRLGATLDATGDGRTKVYGNFGRYYARIPNDLAARALSADDGFVRGDYFDAALTRVVPQGTLAAGTTSHFTLAGVGADIIDPEAKLSYQNEVVLGVDREIMSNMTVGVRYVWRNFGRVLEDVANVPVVGYELELPGAESVEYILTNPSRNTPILPSAAFLGASFDDPVHKYNSLEFTLNRRGTNWSAMTSYRWSRLRGNFEGFYRDDNGQSDPGISSLYDFPTNDPSYTAVGHYHGDIRFLGDANGILPLDRPNQVKLYGNYMWDMGLNLGAGVNFSSGKPFTPMVANPYYSSAGEIPAAARGTGIETVDGFRKRSPFESQLDLQASWAVKRMGTKSLTFVADLFNAFNQRRITNYDQNLELTAGAVNPDFGKPVNSLLSGTPPQFQAPFNLRVGVRFDF
jgi:outer membrane receptor protein involved in Fe transport